jgi:biopolymer transport protein ExbD/biopolymer transport protein TolR
MSAAAGKGRKRRIHHVKKTEMLTPRSDINVTPLVDVVLVLLIIFMVLTPMMSRGRGPAAQDLEPLPAQGQAAAGGGDRPRHQDRHLPVYYDKEKLGLLSEPGVEEKLQDKITRGWDKVKDVDSQGRVYVKAAADIPYAEVYPLLMAINKMGVASIDLGTNELEKK